MSFSLLDFLFPRHCLDCNRLGQYFCSSCRKKELVSPAPVCPYCDCRAVFGQTHARCQRRFGLDGLSVLFKYRTLIQRGIKELKYRGVTDLAEELVETSDKFWNLGQNDLFPNLDRDWFLTPVPLSKRRLRQRGFNQAGLLGEKLCLKTGWGFEELLIRTRNTSPQSSLGSKKERLENIRGSFQIQPGAMLKAKKVILFDDIWTSGSTLKECTQVLKKAGATRVWGLVLAR